MMKFFFLVTKKNFESWDYSPQVSDYQNFQIIRHQVYRSLQYIYFIYIKPNLLAPNHLLIWEIITFNTAQKSSTFLPEIMIPVPSAYIIGSNKAFIPKGRSFMYIANCKGHVTKPLGNSTF